MSLIEEIKKLRGLEQQAIPCKLKIYPSEDAEIDSLLLKQLHDLAPAMLEVLGMFREGDGLHAKLAIAALEFSRQGFVIAGKLSNEDIDNAIAAIHRLQQMAALMEKEEQ